MRALPYDFSVEYIKGSTNQLIDCFSRLEPLDDKIKLPIVQVYEITSRLQAAPSMIQILRDPSAQGTDLYSLEHILQAGWPSEIQEVPLEI